MPIYRAEEVPDLGECTAISRGVPVLPSGMEKEEEGVSTHAHRLLPHNAGARIFEQRKAVLFLFYLHEARKF